jgi:hypothetical protein
MVHMKGSKVIKVVKSKCVCVCACMCLYNWASAAVGGWGGKVHGAHISFWCATMKHSISVSQVTLLILLYFLYLSLFHIHTHDPGADWSKGSLIYSLSDPRITEYEHEYLNLTTRSTEILVLKQTYRIRKAAIFAVRFRPRYLLITMFSPCASWV